MPPFLKPHVKWPFRAVTPVDMRKFFFFWGGGYIDGGSNQMISDDAMLSFHVSK